MNKMIVLLSLLVISFAQISYKSYAQDVYPPGEVDPYPAPTSYPGDTGPIEAGPTVIPNPSPTDPCKNKILCAGPNAGCCRTGTCTATRSGWACK